MTATNNRLKALNNVFPQRGTSATTEQPAAAPTAAQSKRAPSREGKLHISAWLSPDYKASLRAIQVKFPQKQLQEMFSESLNDYFAKHNVPTVRED